MYKIDGRELVPTDEKTLNKNSIYIIIDKHTKKSKIWIWSGSEAKNMDRYFAGVSATKIKSKKRLYGASIEVVEQGHEPGHFPDLSAVEIKEPSEEKIEMQKVIVPLSSEIPVKSPVVNQTKPQGARKTVSAVETRTIQNDEKEFSLFKNKMSSLLKEIAGDLENLQTKIKSFLREI